MDERTDVRTDRRKTNVALAHVYQVGKSSSKFGYSPSRGLRGHSVTGRWTDLTMKSDRRVDGRKKVLLSQTLTTRVVM